MVCGSRKEPALWPQVLVLLGDGPPASKLPSSLWGLARGKFSGGKIVVSSEAHCHHPFYIVSFWEANLSFVCLVLNWGETMEVESR